MVNPIQGRLFWSSGGQGGGGGGGGHKVPLVKTLFPFSESTQVKFSENLSNIESCEENLVSMETMVVVLRWFIIFRFLTRNHHSNIKNFVPINKSKKKVTFSESL